MGLVVEQKLLLGVAPAEVGAQKGEHPVFGGDLPYQHPLQLREADKAGEQVGLLLQVAHRLPHRVHHRVGEIPAHRALLLKTQLVEPPQPQLPLLQAGEEAPHRPPLPLPAELVQGAVHPPGLLPVGLHRPLGVEGGGRLVKWGEVRRLLPVPEAVKDAGEKSGVGAVVEVRDLGPGHETASSLTAGGRSARRYRRWTGPAPAAASAGPPAPQTAGCRTPGWWG